MKPSAGFSLIELIVIMAIAGTLIAMATLNFSAMTKKSHVEGQMKRIHADLMTVRAEAVFEKRPRAVRISGTSFSVYSTENTTAGPKAVTTLRYPVVSALTVTFDTAGMANDFTSPGALCVNEGDSASTDSIVIQRTMLYIGKRKNGTACQSGNIDIK